MQPGLITKPDYYLEMAGAPRQNVYVPGPATPTWTPPLTPPKREHVQVRMEDKMWRPDQKRAAGPSPPSYYYPAGADDRQGFAGIFQNIASCSAIGMYVCYKET